MHRDHEAATDLWSAPLGAWMGVPVRLHVTLVAVLVLAAGAAVQTASFDLGLAIAVFVASLAVHETAHAVAAWRLGGTVDAVVLSPFGGLPASRGPADAESRVFVAMAGPMANLGVVVLAVICLAAWDQPAPAALFVPQLDAGVSPQLGDDQLSPIEPVVALARIAIWINWPLFLLNLLPAFPFDGGEAARSLLAPRTGSTTAAELVGRVALLVGGLLLVVAPVLRSSPDAWPTPATLAASLGVLVCFGSHRDRLLARRGQLYRTGGLSYPSDESGYQLSDDDWLGDDQGRLVVMEMGRHAGRQGLPNRPHVDPSEGSDEAYDDQRLDQVLEKLHRGGMDGLTPDERLFLERASARIRRRRPE